MGKKSLMGSSLNERRNPYVRYCEGCGELYKPSGKFQRYCDECRISRREKTSEKMKQTIRNKTLTKLRRTEKNGE